MSELELLIDLCNNNLSQKLKAESITSYQVEGIEMAEPKQRLNNSKQGMRRMHDKVTHGAIIYCENCHQPKEAHKVCYNCGTYAKKAVLEVKKEK